MLNDEAYFILSEGVSGLIDRAMAAGAMFDDVLEEIKAQCDLAEENREEYEQ